MFISNMALVHISKVCTLICGASCYEVDDVKRNMVNLSHALTIGGFLAAGKDIKRGLAFSCSYDDYKAALADARLDVVEAAKFQEVTE